MKTASSDAMWGRVRLEHPPHGRAPIWVVGDQDARAVVTQSPDQRCPGDEAGGQVDVHVALGRDATVTIADTGCGIPEGALDRVFESFYSSKPERAGLGLAIAWRTAAAHGGRLSIESALGRGTTVEVALPLAESGSAYALE